MDNKDPYATPKINLPKIVATQVDEAPPAPAAAWQPPALSAKTLESLRDAARLMEEDPAVVQAEEPDVESGKVEVAELPEDRYAKVFYRNTSYDNAETHKSIEALCSPLAFEDLILHGRVTQTVPVLPSKLSVVFQSLTGTETSWIDKMSVRKAEEDPLWSIYARLTMSVVSIGKVVLHDFSTEKSRAVDETKFNAKFEQVLGNSEQLIEVLLTNMRWFNIRISSLFENQHEKIKNG